MFRWKNILVQFLHKGGPLPKKIKIFFFWNAWQFIHQSKALVEFRRFLLILKSFTVFLVEKYSKNCEKIWIFDYFYKIVKKWKNSIFMPKTLMLNSKKTLTKKNITCHAFHRFFFWFFLVRVKWKIRFFEL